MSMREVAILHVWPEGEHDEDWDPELDVELELIQPIQNDCPTYVGCDQEGKNYIVRLYTA